MNGLDVNSFGENDCNGSGLQSSEVSHRVNHNLQPKHVWSDDEFKMPDRFAQELEVLERKALSADTNASLTRMSLLRKFDPLVDTTDVANDLTRRTTDMSLNETLSNGRHDREHLEVVSELQMSADESTTLMHFSSPSVVPIVGPNDNRFSDELRNDFRTKELLFEEKLIQRDRQVQRMEERLTEVTANYEKYEFLVNLLHSLNEQMLETASQAIEGLMADKNELISRCNQMTAERSQALEEVNHVEKNFYEVHNRYDKVRTALEEAKQRELMFNEQYMELMDKLKEKEHMYELLKTKAEEKIEHANNYIESARRECESELIGVKAQLKRADMKMNGLQALLDQKTIENDELTKMVDELIANVEK